VTAANADASADKTVGSKKRGRGGGKVPAGSQKKGRSAAAAVNTAAPLFGSYSNLALDAPAAAAAAAAIPACIPPQQQHEEPTGRTSTRRRRHHSSDDGGSRPIADGAGPAWLLPWGQTGLTGSSSDCRGEAGAAAGGIRAAQVNRGAAAAAAAADYVDGDDTEVDETGLTTQEKNRTAQRRFRQRQKDKVSLLAVLCHSV
jgi:hypothetical protein